MLFKNNGVSTFLLLNKMHLISNVNRSDKHHRILYMAVLFTTPPD